MRLINAEGIRIKPEFMHDICGIAMIRVEDIVRILNEQPEIIRCKDCKWSVEHYDMDGNVPYWICKNWDGSTDADGFCHEAERKDNE